MAKLVIVESPAKAKTISQYLGKEYDVQASFGHVRDLPGSAEEIPEAFKKVKWAKLGVNVDDGYEPLYIIPADKKRHVDALKKASKGIDALLLATDEDREGESISWHILQLLKPAKTVKVHRIVFHEITPEAIEEAVRNPREVDEALVRAQETRRILDRLYGYTLSPLLWKKVAPRLSAGRVQSVAVRLVVMKERERKAFVASGYWDLEAELQAQHGTFAAKLARVDGKRIATGQSFDPATGLLKDASNLLLDEPSARALAEAASESSPWTITEIQVTPGKESQPPPFMTSTLQQEANRKLRFTSQRTMQLAQQLYEGIDLNGERIGLITYMRTDSLHLADRAIQQARQVIKDLYGPEFVPEKPNTYKTKAKGAQEAHEAIRPTDLGRRPQDVQRFLDKDQFALYELIWKRTIASQMPPAKVSRTSVQIEVKVNNQDLMFTASGKQIDFAGFLRAYVEGSDDPEAELAGKENLLPALRKGEAVDAKKVEAQGHSTKPPARYTEASLVKKLEDEGIGRPSTYATIISTIQDRGYVFKRANELIPTFTAFAVTELLEGHFRDLVDTEFTAKMEEELDEIAEGERDWHTYLANFYRGVPENPGIEKQVEERASEIPFPAIPLGQDPTTNEPVVIRVGRYGTFVQRGDGGKQNTATVPPETPPADLSLDMALSLIERRSAGESPVGKDANGRNVFVRSGRFGTYMEVEQTDEEKEAKVKPKRVTLPKELSPTELTAEDVATLLRFPIGLDESTTVNVGQYGAYVKRDTEIRNVEDWRQAASLSLEDAERLLAQPKVGKRAALAPGAKAEPIQSFKTDAVESGLVRVMPGRYGPYVTDGKINATLPKDVVPEEVTLDRALELIRHRAENPPIKRSFRRGSGAKKTTRARKTA